MATTTNYSWTTPDDTALVKDGAAAIRSLGSAIDTTVFNNANAAIAKTIVDAKGDIIAATAADTVARLAVGSNDQYLVADSSTATGLKWATLSAGSLTQLATGTLTGASVAITSISGSYTHLQLIITNFKPATDTATLRIRFNNDSNTRYTSSTATSASGTAFGDTNMRLTNDGDDTVAQGLVIANIWNYANTTTWKICEVLGINNSSATTTDFSFAKYNNFYNQTTAVSEINLFPNTGNFTSGNYILYGVK